MKRNCLKENLIYLGLWIILFIAPLLSLYIRTATDATTSFNWNEIMQIWKMFAVFLAIFLLHNFLLAPLLIYKRKKLLYLLFTALLLLGVVLFESQHKPPPPPRREIHNKDRHPSPIKNGNVSPDKQAVGKRHRMPPPPPLEQHEVIAVFILILMFGMNLGLKYYFKNENTAKAIRELERKNLEQQLQYLKYQINPHFLMNTLNNIHALVDIDPQKAQTSILQLSKLMRYVLYDATKNLVPLQQDIDFVSNYIRLMRIRYSDKVAIETDIREPMPDRQIPPLLFISFVENAFKHGISYENESFIQLSIHTDDDKLHFSCRNSKKRTEKPEKTDKGGVGIKNTRQRLDLIYGTDYQLDIRDDDNDYTVSLTIPLTS